MKYYTYVFVRMDIDRTQQTVQASHACIGAGTSFNNPPDSSIVILQAENEEHLKSVSKTLNQSGVTSFIFYEPDFGPMGFTALATRAVSEEERYLFKDYKLWSSKPSIIRKARRMLDGILDSLEKEGC